MATTQEGVGVTFCSWFISNLPSSHPSLPFDTLVTGITPAEKRQRMSGLHASEKKQGLLSTSDEQQRKRELQAETKKRMIISLRMIGNDTRSIPPPDLVNIFIEEGDKGLSRRLNAWKEEKERILSIKTAERSKEERNRAQWLQKQIRKLKKDWPNINTPAEKNGHNEA